MSAGINRISVKKELGISKMFSVSPSGKNVRKTMSIQRSMNHYRIVELKNEKASKELSDDSLEFFELQEAFIDESMKLQDDIKEYVVDTLKLTDDAAEKFDDLTLEEQMMLASKIGAIIMKVDLKKAGEEEVGLKG